MPFSFRAFASVVVVALLASQSIAQIGFDPTGVYIDPKGVLRTRKPDDNKKLAELMKKAAEAKPGAVKGLHYVSLPRLFAEVKQKLDVKQPVPDELKYLGGMTRVQYVFVFPQERDLVIAGPAEPFDTKIADRPLGTITGRPVLQLDDLVTALRTCGPGRQDQSFGCKIEMSRESAMKMVRALKGASDLVRQNPELRGDVAKNMAAAAGTQDVKFLTIEPDTRFAFVMLEADFLLKRLVLGLDRSPAPGLSSYLSMQTSTDVISNRFWFEVQYEPLLASGDGNAFEIRGQSLKIRTEKQFDDRTELPEAKAWADRVTKMYPKLAAVIPAFGDLANLSDLGLVAALIGTDKLHERAGWDAALLAWVLDPKGYPVAKVEAPKTCETLVNYHITPRLAIYAGGGVELRYVDTLKSRAPDAQQALGKATLRPKEWKQAVP